VLPADLVSLLASLSPSSAQVTETLKEALVPLISTKTCNSSCVYAGELTARILCAGYLHGKTDACQVTEGSEWCVLGVRSRCGKDRCPRYALENSGFCGNSLQ